MIVCDAVIRLPNDPLKVNIMGLATQIRVPAENCVSRRPSNFVLNKHIKIIIKLKTFNKDIQKRNY